MKGAGDLLNYTPAATSAPFTHPVTAWTTSGDDPAMVELRVDAPSSRATVVAMPPFSLRILDIPRTATR